MKTRERTASNGYEGGLPSSLSVLGATGSVGRQALDVAKRHAIPVDLLSANTDVRGMEALARRFAPRFCVMADGDAAHDLSTRLRDTGITVRGGESALPETIREVDSPVTVNAILGEAGLLPTLACVSLGRRLALSNKESLVVAGDVVNAEAKKSGCEIIPVDSEHSAIFQCLHAGRASEVRSILLTASGGPFRGMTRKELETVTLRDALAHPTWKMGAKITVDSATMMNKGFEVIEAAHLFGVSPDVIRVVVHPESIIHSAVEYIDSAVVAQLSTPDMRLCVQYALTYPARLPGLTPGLDLFSVGSFHFYPPDPDAFPLLPLAYRAISLGGGVPAVLNAANEVAVAAFLSEKIGFTSIFRIVTETVEKLSGRRTAKTVEELIDADREARGIAASLL